MLNNFKVFNNTMAELRTPAREGGFFSPGNETGNLLYNNLTYNFDYPYANGNYSTAYNTQGYYCTSGAEAFTSCKGFIIRQPLDCDAVDPAYACNPFVNSSSLDFRLAAPEDTGNDVCNLSGISCHDNDKYNKDWTGTTRTNWSRGAIEYSPSNTDSNPPAAPTRLVVR